jgi:hypothetical protein
MDIMAVRKPQQGLNDWGYGQILAVLIWVPILVEFLVVYVKAVVKPFTGTHKRRQELPQGLSDDNQLDGEPSDERKPELKNTVRSSAVIGDTMCE